MMDFRVSFRTKTKQFSFAFSEAFHSDQTRKDALTKRPLDFEKEEETRKDETMKWLESHFGSESRSSRDSRDDDNDTAKKSFFNVTIKSTPATTPTTPGPTNYGANLLSPSKVILPERESPMEKKYFKGISEWSERKESTPRTFQTKTFKDELQGSLERKKLRHHISSREDVRYNRRYAKEDPVRSDEEVRPPPVHNNNEFRYGSKGDVRYRRDSRGGSDESRYLKSSQKEDLGYMSGSRNDLRPRNDSRDELYAKPKRQTGYLRREDSGYVKDSREDIHYIRNASGREDSFIR